MLSRHIPINRQSVTISILSCLSISTQPHATTDTQSLLNIYLILRSNYKIATILRLECLFLPPANQVILFRGCGKRWRWRGCVVKGCVVGTPWSRGRHPSSDPETNALHQEADISPQDPEADTPVETATEVGGTHPTGMHSSLVVCLP